MNTDSSATHQRTPAILHASRSGAGLWWGLLGVVAFSFTVPFTRVAVADGAPPLFVGAGRAAVAAVLAALALAVAGRRLPRGAQWARLAVVAGGVVLGFPLLTSFALTTSSASHGAVVIAVLPVATAVVAVIRGRERPPRAFWTMAALGSLAAVAFALLQGGRWSGLEPADLLLFGAVIAAAFGYAEGGLLARELGSWQTVSWALVLSAPVTILLTLVSLADGPPALSTQGWAAFAYLAAVSMFLGFFAWYRGLAIGPMSRVSQVQLTQPVMSLCWAVLLLREGTLPGTVIGGLAVIACAALAVRVRLRG